MNSLTFEGHLGKDAERRSLPDGTTVLNFSVADSQGRDKPPIWWKCTMFGTRAESLAQYMTKGQSVTVIGTISEREWQTKEGETRKALDVRVSDIALQGGKRESTNAPQTPRSNPAKQANSGFDDMNDIPF